MHEYHPLPDHRRGDHFIADLGLPLFRTGRGIERDDVAFEATCDDQAVASARPARQGQVGLVMPDWRTVCRSNARTPPRTAAA